MSQREDDLLVDAVVQLSVTVIAVLTQVGSGHDLSLTQLRVLGILQDHQPRMAALAEHLGLDRSTVSGLVDRASRRGLVARTADADDRRSSRVALTDQGRELAEGLRGEVAEALAPMTTRLGTADKRALRALCARLIEPSA